IDLLPPKGRLKQSMSVNTAMVLPVMGRIAAGQPIEAVQNPETISLADFVRSKEVFVLEVRGESMQDEAILDGDYVLVEKTKTAHVTIALALSVISEAGDLQSGPLPFFGRSIYALIFWSACASWVLPEIIAWRLKRSPDSSKVRDRGSLNLIVVLWWIGIASD